ncbi:MAG: phytanoyl-CoA dioxygenase family protein [Tepidisphaeraceae bacterium]
MFTANDRQAARFAPPTGVPASARAVLATSLSALTTSAPTASAPTLANPTIAAPASAAPGLPVYLQLPVPPPLVAGGLELDPAKDKLGWMRDSADLLTDIPALRQRMADDGYLLLRGYLNRDDVLAARREVTQRLAAAGHLAPGTDPMLAIPAPDYSGRLAPDLAKDNPTLDRVLYTGPMMQFFRGFFDKDVRHFDYTWFRAIGPGKGTPSHCDSVYMNRGTQNLFTAWTPMGDIDLQMGGLMVLEGSNNNQRLRETYCKTDVDTFCTNREGKRGQDAWSKTSGALSKNARQLAHALSARWLTTEYRAGDVLVFSIFTVHASLDNRSSQIRLSCDARFQPADEAADPRWVGENPIRHSPASKRGRIC